VWQDVYEETEAYSKLLQTSVAQNKGLQQAITNVLPKTKAYSKLLQTSVAQNPDIMEVIWFSTEL
jgi:hypothetical protein